METKVLKPHEFKINEIKNEIIENNLVNLILNLQDLQISEGDINNLYDLIGGKLTNGTTFVVVKKDVNLDNLPDELNIVPTMQEANDLISLEEMMRDLESE